MGKALYRKHRSQSFDQVIGQEHVTKALASAVASGKTAHAYLFSGPRGTGKTSSARIFAHAINGVDYQVENSPVDIIEIDAASNRRIDEMRYIRDKVIIAPTSAKYKVYIIDEAHMLTKEAFNALLKTLEEPPEHAVFILATTEPHKLPDTIISRTQHFRFGPIATDDLKMHLIEVASAEGLKLEDAAAELIAKRANGGARDALSLLDQLQSAAKKSKLEVGHVIDRLGLASDDLIDEIKQSIDRSDIDATIDVLNRSRDMGVSAAQLADQLIEDLHAKDPTGSLNLCRDLLAVRGSARPDLELRFALLGAFDTQLKPESAKAATAPVLTKSKAKQPAPVSQPSKPKESINKPQAEEPAVEPETKVTHEPKKDLPEPDDGTLSAIYDIWDEVLDYAKEKSPGSVYATMRMAKPLVKDGQLLLVFRFPFHRKRAEGSQFAPVISSLISDQLEAKVEVKMADEKNHAAKPKKDPLAKTAKPAAVDSIIDIMGGGEEVSV